MQLDLCPCDKITKMVIVCTDCLNVAYSDEVKLDLHLHRRMGRKQKATVAHEINIQAVLAAKQHYSYPELLDADSSGEKE